MNRPVLQRIQKLYNTVRRFATKEIIQDGPKPIKLTILGNMENCGRALGLLLKQCHGINELRLYGLTEVVCATATDLAVIDTNTSVKAYQGGTLLLREAIKDVDIIVIVGGEPDRVSLTEKDLFNKNIDVMRHYTIHITDFNPNAIVLIATPPVNLFVPMVSAELSKTGSFNPSKVIGLCNIWAIRSNCLIAKELNIDPTKVLCPIIGGSDRRTVLPVLSQTIPKISKNEEELEELRKQILDSESKVLHEKLMDHLGPSCLSPAFAISRFIYSLIKAMNGDKECIECGYVAQTGHIGDFLPFMTTPMKLGPNGVDTTYMPKLTSKECDLLREIHPVLMKDIQIGESMVSGEVIRTTRCENIKPDYCEKVIRSPDSIIGDVVVDTSKTNEFQIIQ